jgi:Spondin_N
MNWNEKIFVRMVDRCFSHPVVACCVMLGLLFGWSCPVLGETISYRVDFHAGWSSQSHPGAYPLGGGHFSSLVGAVHNDRVQFWQPGGLASNGIELMAEQGGVQLLAGEVQQAIGLGNAASTIFGSGAISPGATFTTLEVSSAFPLVTLVTMVAPSPDWFVGVHDLDLRDGGSWIDEMIVDLYAYDAGTDNGITFTAPDIDAQPRQPIALLGAPFTGNSSPLGTFTFTRTSPIPEPSLNGFLILVAAWIRNRSSRRHVLFFGSFGGSFRTS